MVLKSSHVVIVVLGLALISSTYLNVLYWLNTNLNRTPTEIVTITTTVLNTSTVTETHPPGPSPSFERHIGAVAVTRIATDSLFDTSRLVGAVLNITLKVTPGDGRILVDTETGTGIEFQASARTAVQVASRLAGWDFSNSDIIFSVKAANSVESVDGASAGAAMTILLLSEVRKVDLRRDVLITGVVNADGTIGPVSGVPEKAEAAGKFGASLFLVPPGQAVANVEVCKDSRRGNIIVRSCTLEARDLSEIVGKKYGLKIIEVQTVEDAMRIFSK